jgi:hypothetical protein
MKKLFIIAVAVADFGNMGIAYICNRSILPILLGGLINAIFAMILWYAIFLGRIITKQEGCIYRSKEPVRFWTIFLIMLIGYMAGFIGPWKI